MPGKGPALDRGPLQLRPDGGDAALVWAPVLASLARTHRVFTVERPGHGLATAFDHHGVDLLEGGGRRLSGTEECVDVG